MLNSFGNVARQGGARLPKLVRELNGAVADLGVLLPYALGSMMGGLLPIAGVLAGFGAGYVLTAFVYRLPVAVQPMKAIGAVALSGGLTGPQLMLSGIAIGLCLMVLGVSGAARRMARLLPQSVTSGLQLGLGGMLGLYAFSLISESLWQGVLAVAVLLALGRFTRLPAALAVVLGAAVCSYAFGSPPAPAAASTPPGLHDFSWSDLMVAFASGVLPQLPLTLVNALVVTAALAHELFPAGSSSVNETRLALTSGGLNLALCPLGAMPICHGAGGLAAHHRFGARTGLGTGLLGLSLLALAAVPVDSALQLLLLIPMPVLGALLLFSAVELAATPRLLDATPSCKGVIGLTAVATLLGTPALGGAIGLVAEELRRRLVRILTNSAAVETGR